MVRLAKLARASHSGLDNDDMNDEAHDVFSVLGLHSDVLELILEACLLKARHRAAGSSLRSCLQTILLFCRLIQHLENDKIDEVVAVKTLEELHVKFTASVLSVVRHSSGTSRRSTVLMMFIYTPAQACSVIGGEERSSIQAAASLGCPGCGWGRCCEGWHERFGGFASPSRRYPVVQEVW